MADAKNRWRLGAATAGFMMAAAIFSMSVNAGITAPPVATVVAVGENARDAERFDTYLSKTGFRVARLVDTAATTADVLTALERGVFVRWFYYSGPGGPDGLAAYDSRSAARTIFLSLAALVESAAAGSPREVVFLLDAEIHPSQLEAAKMAAARRMPNTNFVVISAARPGDKVHASPGGGAFTTAFLHAVDNSDGAASDNFIGLLELASRINKSPEMRKAEQTASYFAMVSGAPPTVEFYPKPQ